MSRPLLAAIALVVAACGSGGETGTDGTDLPTPTPVPTISGVGSLPDTIPPEREVSLVVVTRPVTTDGTPIELLGEQVAGNRLLVIGDSILAATASRFGREMCDALVPMRWAVEVNAEPGRFVDFGTRVLDRRLDAADDGGNGDWDAVVVHLGSNYRGEIEPFEAELSEIVERVAPRPTLLFTVTEYRPAWADVNEVIRAVAREHEHVTLIDWESVARTPGVLSGDGLHPTDAGEDLLVELTAAALGPARVPIEGECLRSDFTDDSAIGLGTGSATGGTTTGGSTTGGSTTRGSTSGGSSGGSSGGTSGGTSGGGTSGGSTGGATTTTTVGTTTGGGTGGGGTTGGSTTTTTPGGGTGGGTGGGATTTSPPVTAPPSTSPPSTSPPPTAPPSTSPPPTLPPPTVPTTTPDG